MKVVSVFLHFVVTILGAALLTHALYTTEIGGYIVRLVPDRVWDQVYQRFGLEGAETTSNAELIVWLFACFAMSTALVFGGSAFLRRFYTSKKESKKNAQEKGPEKAEKKAEKGPGSNGAKISREHL